MNIVYCLDINYAEMTKKSIDSILKFNPKANIVIVSENEIPDLKQYTNFRFDLSKYSFKQRSANDRITRASYLRLFLSEILPYDKCLYLDGDILCQKPLKSLYEMDCEYINAIESHTYSKKQAKELGIERYVNAGVLLMNLKALKEDNFREKCFEKQDFNVSLWCHEETLINGNYNSKIKIIDKKYNYCHNRIYEKSINENNAYLLHYIGANKEIRDYEYSNIPEVKEFIKDKRVAIVGNASSIFDKQNGALIDSFDVVIRFNKGFITKPESQGTKVDIHMLAVTLKDNEYNLLRPKFRLNRSRFYNNPCKTIMWVDRKRLCQGELQPSTGYMAIDLCLSSKAKEIALFGFDFNKTGSFPNAAVYVSLHDFKSEERNILEFENAGLLEIK